MFFRTSPADAEEEDMQKSFSHRFLDVLAPPIIVVTFPLNVDLKMR